jgi:hypothetical protein
VDLARLPVSPALRDELEGLVDIYDTSLNWDYPPDPGPWDEQTCREFNAAVRIAMAKLREELGPRWRILDEFEEVRAG